MNIDGLMIIYEMRKRDTIFEKLFECLSRDEKNEIWEQVTGFEYECPLKKEVYENAKEGTKE